MPEARHLPANLGEMLPVHRGDCSADLHACIGKDLAAGVLRLGSGDTDTHLNGVVTLAVESMFEKGCRPDPNDPPEMNPSTSRPYFGRYPVIFK